MQDRRYRRELKDRQAGERKSRRYRRELKDRQAGEEKGRRAGRGEEGQTDIPTHLVSFIHDPSCEQMRLESESERKPGSQRRFAVAP